MSLEKIHLEILQLLMDNVPGDFSDSGDISRKIGLVQLHTGFFRKGWSSISITDEGIDVMEPEDDWDQDPEASPE
jgi:hypothetical protein